MIQASSKTTKSTDSPTLIVLAQHGIVGGGTETPIDTTYLADMEKRP